MKNRFKKTILPVLGILLFTGIAYGQNYNGSKTLNKTVAVAADIHISMSNSSGDIEIVAGDVNSVTIKTDAKIEGKSKEDVDKVIKAIENFTFELNGNNLQIDTRFYKNMNSNGFRSTLTLLDGEKVEIKEFEIKHVLTIPKSAWLRLDNKYSEIEMQDISGNVEFSLYSSTIHAGNFGGEAKISMKYSKAFLGDLKDVTFDLYDSDAVLKNCGDVNISSKYSKFEAEKTGNLKIDSYDDNYSVRSVPQISVVAKYSDFEFPSAVDEARLDFYDSNLKTGGLAQCSYSGKYSELIFGSIKNLDISASYDDSFKAGKVKLAKIAESKYSDYTFEEAAGFVYSGYDDNIILSALNQGEGEINVTGKYVKLNITAGATPYQVNFKIQYPKINIPDNVAISQKISENSHLTLIGNSSGKKIIVNGYDMTVNIK